MLITETELRNSIRSLILERHRQEQYRRIVENAEDSAKQFIEDMKQTSEELDDSLEQANEDPEALLDTVKDAEDTVEKIQEAMFLKHGVIAETTDRELLKEEFGVLLATSIALAAPKVIELVVAGVAWCMGDQGPMKDEHKEAMDKLEAHHEEHGDDHEHSDKYANKYLNMIDHFAHSIHEKYIQLIAGVLISAFEVKQKARAGVEFLKFWKNKQAKDVEYERMEAESKEFRKKVKKIANGCLMLIVAVLAVVSGSGAIAALGKGHQGLALLETVLGAVKTYEIAPLGKELVANAPQILELLLKLGRM